MLNSRPLQTPLTIATGANLGREWSEPLSCSDWHLVHPFAGVGLVNGSLTRVGVATPMASFAIKWASHTFHVVWDNFARKKFGAALLLRWFH